MSSLTLPTSIQNHILKRFTVLKKIGSGAYGHVWKVEQKGSKRIYALKKIFDAFQHSTDAQRTYRQIQILRQLDHPNIVKLHQTIRAQNNKDVYLIFQFMEADLHNVISEDILRSIHIKFIIYQMAKALKYMHTGKVIHRDLKPSNVLVNSNCSIKLCDFGLVRCLKSEKDQAVMTEGVATRWYRAPEILFGSRNYSTPADIWSFGCIIYELLAQKPLFPGNSTVDQIQKICAFTGYPSEEDIDSLDSQISRSLIKEIKFSSLTKPAHIIKDFDSYYSDLLQRVLTFNPKKRLSIDEILSHQALKEFRKEEEQICCPKQIRPFIDDNKKISVQEYRKLIYGSNSNEPKQKVYSSSLGTGCASPKYQPYFNKSNLVLSSNKLNELKTEVNSKKHLLERPKPFSGNTVNIPEEIPKNGDKLYPGTKFVKSAKEFVSMEYLSQHKKTFDKKDYNIDDIPNQEETETYHNLYQTEAKLKMNSQNEMHQKGGQTRSPYPTFKHPSQNGYAYNSSTSIFSNVSTNSPSQLISKSPVPGTMAPSFNSAQIKQKLEYFRSHKSSTTLHPTHFEPLQKTHYQLPSFNKANTVKNQ